MSSETAGQPVMHGSMYRNGVPGTLCREGWEPMVTTVSDKVTCPECRHKIDGTRPEPLEPPSDLRARAEGWNAGYAQASRHAAQGMLGSCSPGNPYRAALSAQPGDGGR